MENKKINEDILEIWGDHPKERGNNWPVLYPNFVDSKILFIGFNPSGDGESKFKLNNTSDLKNEEKISSQIEIEKDAKENYIKYFKPFQDISNSINGDKLKFNHLDLYFYREHNSKDFLDRLKEEDLKEFFEKQLKIATETIEKLNPGIIFIANKNASDIIKDKFKIDESKFDGEGFDRIIINNKPIPIFFSGMISSARIIDEHSLQRLIWHIKKALNSR